LWSCLPPAATAGPRPTVLGSPLPALKNSARVGWLISIADGPPALSTTWSQRSTARGESGPSNEAFATLVDGLGVAINQPQGGTLVADSVFFEVYVQSVFEIATVGSATAKSARPTKRRSGPDHQRRMSGRPHSSQVGAPRGRGSGRPGDLYSIGKPGCSSTLSRRRALQRQPL
jgi:hypothetical protein